ncbi:ABC transporter substrate-binding protein [Frankia sp. CNm7]|uniref:ABC transporter substrate-binding protein n=1 Tax=Frankia nepalensis TaxID=1836974 RepID=A0A937RQ11_9ACTN|nr:ABC transporter substrate-binding protein [Frankia nepalensis]MBL7502035.1 ABC transporter substrate-binding protein [Frankia nepalensis]MBL7511941.1 ABC transporter substrate-binding protein [Frankia nepalensis]MBL7524286.1 ABC transporter substrate-binding protein [Frankia nepalensis]MBL7630533.1 ABC transporter substrate-binding protein [Frankia nepalensis]
MVSTALLAAAGCGGSTGSSNTGTDCSTPGFSPTSIKLGQVYPDSGVLGEPFRAARSGVQARIEQANADGGINGRTIEYTWRDDRGEPDGNSLAAHELVEDEQVFGLLETTLAASGSAQYLADLRVPVAGMPSEALWTRYRNMFTTGYTITEAGSVDTFGRYIQAQGGTTAAVIRTDVLAPATDITRKIEQGAAQVGVRILPQPFIFNPTVGSVQQLAASIKNSGADVLIGGIGPDDWAKVLQAVQASGARIKVVLVPGGYDSTLLHLYGTAGPPVSTFLSLVPFELGGPAHERYLAAMAAYAPEIADPRTQIALTAYVQTDLFLHGLAVAGPCPTREEFIDRLRAVDDYDAGGLLPKPIDLTANFGKISQCYVFLRINNTANGFDVVPNPDPAANPAYTWCGDRID